MRTEDIATTRASGNRRLIGYSVDARKMATIAKNGMPKINNECINCLSEMYSVYDINCFNRAITFDVDQKLKQTSSKCQMKGIDNGGR